eukprot:652083-Pelagomonas_calceolata.AAC.1
MNNNKVWRRGSSNCQGRLYEVYLGPHNNLPLTYAQLYSTSFINDTAPSCNNSAGYVWLQGICLLGSVPKQMIRVKLSATLNVRATRMPWLGSKAEHQLLHAQQNLLLRPVHATLSHPALDSVSVLHAMWLGL